MSAASPRIAGIALVLLLSLLGSSTLAQPATAADPIESTLSASREAHKGVTVTVDGAQIALLVTEIRDGFVFGRSQQYDRIVIRLDQIDAVAQ